MVHAESLSFHGIVTVLITAASADFDICVLGQLRIFCTSGAIGSSAKIDTVDKRNTVDIILSFER
jgi:hypothetical protein